MVSKIIAFFIELLKTVAIVFILAFIIRFFIIQPFIIEGNSMEPNYHNRQLILIDKLSYRFHQPKRTDVIVFESPQNHAVYYIKRVIGLPGQIVTIKDGDVYINDAKLSEPYLASGQKTTVGNDPAQPFSITVGANQLFVMGDNRDQSSDSREWGLLDENLISGKLLVVIYPRDAQIMSSQAENKSSQLGYQHPFPSLPK